MEAQTYVVSKKANSNMQPLAIKKALKSVIEKTVEKLIGKDKAKNKKNAVILKKNIYKNEMSYIYSFKIINARSYLNLYYVKLNVFIRQRRLISKLKDLGFKTAKAVLSGRRIKYHVYYIKFIGNFRYADTNKLQKLMIKHSKHLENLYISSFSNNFIEIKVLYFGSIIRFAKTVTSMINTYLKAKVYPVKGNVVVVNVE